MTSSTARLVLVDCVKDWLEFKEEQYEDEDDLLLAMKEISQRQTELKITENEWISTRTLGRIKKERRMETFQYQARKRYQGCIDRQRNSYQCGESYRHGERQRSSSRRSQNVLGRS